MLRSEYIIDVLNLSKTFKSVRAVDDISFQIKLGEIVGFIGPNGSGKTTTIQMLCGLLKPTSGEGYCLGYDIKSESKKIKSQVGYMSQDFSLYNDLTVYQNLDIFARLYGIRNRSKIINNKIEQFGLGPYRNLITRSLSGGWKQKLSLAASMIHNPILMLLDEPTAAIDLKSRREFWELIYNLSQEGVTIILSTHDLEEIEFCKRIIYMSYGQIVIDSSISEIVEKVELITWKVTGPNLILLSEQLKVLPGVDQVIVYYNSLHISGTNFEVISKEIEPYQELTRYHWNRIPPSLEDIFIWLTSKTDTTHER